MVFSVSPSITIREVDATAVVPAISSTQAAIAGVFRWGPELEPVLITSEENLKNRFGAPTDFNAETFFTAADFLAYSNALYVTRVTDGATVAQADANTSIYDGNAPFEAKYKGSLGNSLEISIINSADAYEKEIVDLGLEADTVTASFNGTTIAFTSSLSLGVSETDIAENDIIRIGSSAQGYQELVVDSFTIVDDLISTYTLVFKNKYTLPAENSELISSGFTITRRWRYFNLVDAAPNTGNFHVVVTDKNGDISGSTNEILEVYQNLSSTSTSKLEDGSTNYYVTVIDNSSNWITTTDDPFISSTAPTYISLVGGDDGEEEDTISFGELAKGYDTYSNAEEFDIAFILQGKARAGANDSGLANYIIGNICERRKDCVLFISPSLADVVTPSNPNDKLNNVIDFRDELQSSSYWFLDSGYKYRYDKYNDVYRWVPLNGDMAGLWARVTPWESAAGYNRGIIKNVIKLAFNPNKEQRDVLYGKDINPVMTKAGQGTLLFGDKTGLGTYTGSAFTRLNVRRLFIVVEKAIATTSQQFLFEFNDEFTQSQFKNLVEPLLRDIQGRRGIIDFRVVSDSRVNTPDVIDRNMFRGNIYIKPARSINFIELTFVATRTGVEFDEIIGQTV